MFAQIPQFFFPSRAVQQPAPIGDHRQHRSNMHQAVVAAGQMCFRTAPRPIGGIERQASPHRVQFHVPRRRQQVRLVHHEGSKTPLPQVASPFFAEIDSPGITAMGLADGPSQALLRTGEPQSNEHDWASGSMPISAPRAPYTTRPSVPNRPHNLHRKKTSAADDFHAGLRDAANPEQPISPT